MRTRTVAAACALLLAPSLGRAELPAAFVLKSARIDLPNGARMFPGGKEAEAINANCLTCHSAGMVLNQPPLAKAAWDATVRKMIGVYKAPVAADDIAPIVAYLAATKGPK